jgi:hypothetical protein
MQSFLERRIERVNQRMVLLAPTGMPVPAHFRKVTVDAARHGRHMRELQRVRGDIYLRDGALRREQLTAGRHRTPEDSKSWHLLMFHEGRQLSSCVWYRQHDSSAGFEELRAYNNPLRTSPEWSGVLVRAIEKELAQARRDRLSYAEIGGWAVAEQSRCTAEGLLLALAAYSLGRIMGGALGLTTATARHSSATILKRLGGSPLAIDGVTLPAYYDPKYDCQMELLRFDSRRPDPRFKLLVESLQRQLRETLVVAPDVAATAGLPYQRPVRPRIPAVAGTC